MIKAKTNVHEFCRNFQNDLFFQFARLSSKSEKNVNLR